MLANLFTPYAGVGELILRLALGVTFFAHGRGKLKNPAGFAAFLRQIHVPAPLFNAWLVALLETAGAVLLILGIATRILALGLAVDMGVALATVRIGKAPFASGPQGGGWELEFLLLAVAVALLFTGAGRFALDPLRRPRARAPRLGLRWRRGTRRSRAAWARVVGRSPRRRATPRLPRSSFRRGRCRYAR